MTGTAAVRYPSLFVIAVKRIWSIIALGLALLNSCQKPESQTPAQPEPEPEPLPGFVAVIDSPFVAPLQGAVGIVDTVTLAWGKNCCISINGKDSYYAQSGGQSITRFTTSGPDVAPAKGSPAYTAYYPVLAEGYLSGIQPRFAGEVPVFPLFATDDGDTLHFRHLTAALVLSLSCSEDSLLVSKIEVGCSNPLCGSFVLQGGEVKMTAPFGSIICETRECVGPGESLFWFIVPECDCTDLRVTVTDSAGADVTYDCPPVRFECGHSSYVALTPRPRDFIPSDTIYYTTTDGQIITPYNLAPATNTYAAGKGVMVFSRALNTITSNAFDNTAGYCPDAERLESIQLPRSISALGNYLFRNCVNLKELEFPAGGAFVSVPASICYGCTALRKVVMPESVTKINNNAFQNCSALEDIVLPQGIKTIPQNTFNGCSSLRVLDIPDSVNVVGVKAFMGTALENLTLPTGVTALSSQLCQDCRNLEELTLLCEGQVVTFASNALKNCGALKRICVPAALVEDYKNDSGWKTYADLITPLPL